MLLKGKFCKFQKGIIWSRYKNTLVGAGEMAQRCSCTDSPGMNPWVWVPSFHMKSQERLHCMPTLVAGDRQTSRAHGLVSLAYTMSFQFNGRPCLKTVTLRERKTTDVTLWSLSVSLSLYVCTFTHTLTNRNYYTALHKCIILFSSKVSSNSLNVERCHETARKISLNWLF